MSQEAFLEQFEQIRLEIEKRLLPMRESSQLLARWGEDREGTAQRHLHAIPTVMALLRFLAHSPRTEGALTDRLDVAARRLLATPQVPHTLMCFGVAFYYRAVARRTGDPEFAQAVARIATLSTLGEQALERVDWVVSAMVRSRQGGSQDWLAPALLLVSWLTGTADPSWARQAYPFLERYQEFVIEATDQALKYRIHMGFPW